MYQRSSIEYIGTDHVYYNVVIVNNINNETFAPIPATFVENRTNAVIDKPSDYYLSVIRFYCPGNDIPTTVLPIKSFPNTDPNITELAVVLSYNGINSDPINVIYFSQTQRYAVPPPLSITNPNASVIPYYYIYNYQHVLDMANIALASALTNLQAKPGTGAIAAATPPFFTYDAVTELLTLNATAAFYDTSALALPIKIFGNTPFISFFDAFPFLDVNTFLFAPSLDTYQFLIKDTGNNTTAGVIHYLQEYVIVGLWNVFKTLVFTTGTIPIEAELIPSLDGSGNTIGRRILTDFDPLVNSEPGQASSILQYYPQGPYRLINLVSNTPLIKFDINIYWQDKKQNLYPLNILYNDSVSIKFLFVKKNVYNGK
jgi:hypothetical protein